MAMETSVKVGVLGKQADAKGLEYLNEASLTLPVASSALNHGSYTL